MEGLMYPLLDNTVPSWAVPLIALAPAAIAFLVHYAIRKDIVDIHHSVLGLLFAFFSTILITDALKVSVGRPRPDFFIRCFPSGVPVYSSSGNALCNGIPSVCPFSGLAYLSFFLAAKLHSLSSSATHLWRLLPPALPLVGGVAVGITRIDDYWHFPFDVFVGSLIGISFAAICYFMHYPSLRHDYCHLPRDVVRSEVSRRAVLDDNVDSSLDVPTNGDGSSQV
ncbi:unnamed protein product [Closterium sp. NIES-64]|nr:unnamed protein product [Closterium sp. NIES-64]